MKMIDLAENYLKYSKDTNFCYNEHRMVSLLYLAYCSLFKNNLDSTNLYLDSILNSKQKNEIRDKALKFKTKLHSLKLNP